jgi:hypothetical protein
VQLERYKISWLWGLMTAVITKKEGRRSGPGGGGLN